MFDRPVVLLRMEAAALLVAAVFAYHSLDASWVLFAVLFFVPDLFMLGYLVSVRAGTFIYNFGHTLWVPGPLAFFGWRMERRLLLSLAVIWIGHIAFDRLLGFGLKYPTQFKDTHLRHLD